MHNSPPITSKSNVVHFDFRPDRNVDLNDRTHQRLVRVVRYIDRDMPIRYENEVLMLTIGCNLRIITMKSLDAEDRNEVNTTVAGLIASATVQACALLAGFESMRVVLAVRANVCKAHGIDSVSLDASMARMVETNPGAVDDLYERIRRFVNRPTGATYARVLSAIDRVGVERSV